MGHPLDPLREVRLVPLRSRRPYRLDLHCIVDNLKTHDTDRVHDFFTDHPPRKSQCLYDAIILA